MKLKDINFNKNYIVEKISANDEIKRRLNDIGLIDGTKVKLIYVSPSKRIKAYLIRNSIIAIRNNNAENILVGELDD